MPIVISPHIAPISMRPGATLYRGLNDDELDAYDRIGRVSLRPRETVHVEHSIGFHFAENQELATHHCRGFRRRFTSLSLSRDIALWYATSGGYRNEKARGPDGQVRDRGGTLVLEPWGRSIIERMVELRLRGCSLKVIAERIANEGHGAKPKQLRGFRGSGRHKRVEQILKNPFYVGEFKWRGQLYQGAHEPVLTRKQWNDLQATFNGTPRSP